MDLENIRCPSCRHPLEPSSGRDQEIHCSFCGASYPARNGIIDFIPQDDFYWGEIDRDRMMTINSQAEEWEDWYGSITRNLIDRPRLVKYITDPSRLGWLFHCYDEQNTNACLDVGSGWGLLSFGLSRFYKTVYSVDRVFERLHFQSIRGQIDGIRNIHFLRSDFLKLPIEDHSLDLIALNGVFEWVGMSDHSQQPDELQKKFLEEIARLLKPGGRIYLGIENRLGALYFLGHKDHSGLPFTSLVPRSVADRMVSFASRNTGANTPDKKFFHKTQSHYRTYTYTLWGYQKLLKQAGFDSIAPYWAWQSYSYPRMSGTMDAASIRYMASNLGHSIHRSWKRWIVRLILAMPNFALSLLIKLFLPDFLIIAGRKHGSAASLQDRILAGEPSATSFVRVSPGSGTTLETTYLLLDKKANASKSIRVTARNAAPNAARSLVVAEEPGVAGRLIRTSHKEDVTLAAKWLAGFQLGSKKGEWVDQQLAEEIRTLTRSAASLPGFEPLRRPIREFERKYINTLRSTGLSVVSEQGDFTPLNLVITPGDGLCPADWRFSREQGVPLMDIGGFYLSLLQRSSDGNDFGKGFNMDGPPDWFAQQLRDHVQVPFSMTPVYYLLRVVNRISEGQEAAPFKNTALAQLSGLLGFALDHSLTMADG